MSLRTTNCAANKTAQWELLKDRTTHIFGELWDSQNPRHAENNVDETRRKAIDVPRQQHRQDRKDGHRYYEGNRRQVIDKIDPVERDALYWQRTDGRQPSCNHQQQPTNQIASGCKAKNDIHRSTAAQRERRPRASEKPQHLLHSQDIEKGFGTEKALF